MGPTCLPAHQKVTVMHMEQLITQLLKVKEYWIDNNDIAGAIVSVHYIRVVAKSNRLKNLLGDVGKKPTDSIRGQNLLQKKMNKGKQSISMFLHIMFRCQRLIERLIT